MRVYWTITPDIPVYAIGSWPSREQARSALVEHGLGDDKMMVIPLYADDPAREEKATALIERITRTIEDAGGDPEVVAGFDASAQACRALGRALLDAANQPEEAPTSTNDPREDPSPEDASAQAWDADLFVVTATYHPSGDLTHGIPAGECIIGALGGPQTGWQADTFLAALGNGPEGRFVRLIGTAGGSRDVWELLSEALRARHDQPPLGHLQDRAEQARRHIAAQRREV